MGTRARNVLTCLAAVILLTVAAGCGSDDPESAAPEQTVADEAFARAPEPLWALYEERNELLDGGEEAFRDRLEELRGYPVVVNKWASWCDPCRAEFPFFQRQAIKRGKEIAFLGVDGQDNDANAKRFLAKFPVSYPSYKDPSLNVAASFNGAGPFPSTAFYDRKGKLAYHRQGGYATEARLVEDIERYAR